MLKWQCQCPPNYVLSRVTSGKRGDRWNWSYVSGKFSFTCVLMLSTIHRWLFEEKSSYALTYGIVLICSNGSVGEAAPPLSQPDKWDPSFETHWLLWLLVMEFIQVMLARLLGSSAVSSHDGRWRQNIQLKFVTLTSISCTKQEKSIVDMTLNKHRKWVWTLKILL